MSGLVPVGFAAAPPAAASACAADRNLKSPSLATADDLVRWYKSKRITNATAHVPVEELARLFIAEGNIEGIAGDIAFVQTMVETGWLRFPAHGQVRPEFHNYSGIGAVDGGNTPNVFPDALTGVRAQIQHLRVYAEPGLTAAKLRRPLVDPRFAAAQWSVRAHGAAPTVTSLSGRWATDPTYGAKIMALHNEMLTYNRKDCSVVK